MNVSWQILEEAEKMAETEMEDLAVNMLRTLR